MACGGAFVPLTRFQQSVVRLLAQNRSEDSHLAGGAAIHFEPTSQRYSNDLDYFHDSVERVASAFAADEALLRSHAYHVELDMRQPGYIRATIAKGKSSTKIEWAHDSAWRFVPALQSAQSGYQLHPVDLAINKILALVGRDEPRDFLDTIFLHETVLPLGALCWAAAGKDPGFTPQSLLELLRRRGKYHPEDFDRLHLVYKVNLQDLKQRWRTALDNAENFILSRPASEIGCLYYSLKQKKFVAPSNKDAVGPRRDIRPHYGRPGGILPRVL